MENSIVMHNVEQAYGKKIVLKGINLSIRAGCIYGILGPSGCGKTTLIKAMAGILVPTRGDIRILGKRMPNLAVMEKIGYMAQADALYQMLRGRENLEFFGALYQLRQRELKKRIDDALALVNLTDAGEQLVCSYSGGMKRRLSLAATILHRPQVMLLDEPTVGIDPLLRRDIWRALHAMAKAGAAVIVTTHVMDEADRCTQLLLMREGQILAQGTPEAIQAGYGVSTIEDVFLKMKKEGE